MLAFVHIEKTAGTSLIHILRHNYFMQYMDVRPFRKESKNLFTVQDMQLAKKVNPFIRAIGGHAVVPYNNLDKTAEEFRYITLLRNPIERYISQYRHWVEKKHYDTTIEQFMERRELWNFQTKKIAGTEDLEAAKHCLREKFLTVGVVEDFDEFLVLFKQAVGDKCFDMRYVIQNTAAKKSPITDIKERWFGEIQKRNELDIALYDFVVNELIPEQRKRYGRSFDADLNNFKQLNEDGPKMMKRYLDYILRKFYIEPVTGLIRMLHGKPYKGSY